MNDHIPAVPSTTGYDPESYLITLVAEVRRRVCFIGGLSAADRDDICQMTLLAFCRDAESIRARYPEPGVWAGVNLRGRAVDFGRREGAQRGEGARHTRRVGAFDTTNRDCQEMFSIDTDPFEQFLAHDELAPLLAILTPADRALVYLVHGLQMSNRDAAGVLGLTDSCASRRLTRALKRMRAFTVAA